MKVIFNIIMIHLMFVIWLLVALMWLPGCGTDSDGGETETNHECVGVNGADGADGKDGIGCEVSEVDNGVLIRCGDSHAVILRDSTTETSIIPVIEVLDPCGDMPDEVDEVIIRLPDGRLLATSKKGPAKRFLTILGAGKYRTTDSQMCPFTVWENGEISWE